MTGTEFYDAVEGPPDLSLGTKDGRLCVRHAPTRALYEIDPAKLADADWPTVEAVLTGKRDAKVLRHMTRIVGYYSVIENWNRSKLGEFADRQKGNYLVLEVAT